MSREQRLRATPILVVLMLAPAVAVAAGSNGNGVAGGTPGGVASALTCLLTGGSNCTMSGFVVDGSATTTVADDGAGTKPAATITPAVGLQLLACNDSTGNTITMSEVGAVAGTIVRLLNTGSGNCEFADTAGVTNLEGAYVMAPTEDLVLMYGNSTWTETTRGTVAKTITGTGDRVRATTPTLVTPVIGAATGTSLGLSGAMSSVGVLNTGTNNTSGTTTANLSTSNVTATAGTDTFWAWDGTPTNNTDNLYQWRSGTTAIMDLRGNNGSGSGVVLAFPGATAISPGGVLTISTTSSVAGAGVSIASGANLAGEVGVDLGSNDTSTAVTLARFLRDADGAGNVVLSIMGSGHIASTAAAVVDGGGTCTTVSLAGNDVRGTITATCTAAQTEIITFGVGYTSAPICTCTPANAAAGAATAIVFCAASASALTVTSVGAMTSGAVNYICIE